MAHARLGEQAARRGGEQILRPDGHGGDEGEPAAREPHGAVDIHEPHPHMVAPEPRTVARAETALPEPHALGCGGPLQGVGIDEGRAAHTVVDEVGGVVGLVGIAGVCGSADNALEDDGVPLGEAPRRAVGDGGELHYPAALHRPVAGPHAARHDAHSD